MQQIISQTDLEILKANHQVVNFMPEYDGIIAIVDLEVLQFLVNSLPSTTYVEAKADFIKTIDHLKVADEKDFKVMLNMVECWLKFQKSVNAVKTFKLESDEARKLREEGIW